VSASSLLTLSTRIFIEAAALIAFSVSSGLNRAALASPSSSLNTTTVGANMIAVDTLVHNFFAPNRHTEPFCGQARLWLRLLPAKRVR
jgi:hypothetical protein